MKLYNTLTRQLEPVTSEDGVFRMYVCGITPYDTTHLGHAFTFIAFDVLERYLEFCGYRTITVQNVTDIDDDILRRARQVGIPWRQLAEQETQKYLDDMQSLNVRRPDHFPRATEQIEQIQTMVADLLAKGCAYERNGSVYYHVRRDPDFGQLAKMGYAEMLATANERGNYPDDPNKDDPLDFVLWQAAQPDEPTWDSPWGPGRPGWHIECSAMNLRYLGPCIDVHGGGSDLIFPHHDCEIAQSEHHTGQQPFVRYWFHVAMVRLDGEKMSKSLGNMLFISDLLRDHTADTIRGWVLEHHYRDAWNADGYRDALAAMQARLDRWHAALALPGVSGPALDPEPYRANFASAMDDDLDTGGALAHLDTLAQAIESAAADHDVRAAQETLRTLADVLGLRLERA
ncbi:MAG: cysteine--tRNA ligase [Chloroflexi bacterium]|nr:cysteine--tRNA ligase [Chloroflexota bacterium]